MQRVSNTSLTNFPAQPPQFGYTVTNAFPGLTLTQPVCIASPPGETNRLFILEKGGSIVVITNLASPNRTVFMSLSVFSSGEAGLLGLAFHPNYSSNGFFYVFTSQSLNTSQGSGLHQCISRFQVTATNANVALSSTEQFLIRQFDDANNHNGGDLHFGPDGYLYASVGDEGPQYNGAQVLIPHVANRAFEVQATTNLFNSNEWNTLNIPDNAPFYPISNRTTTVTEPSQPVGPRYYRARVFEP